MRKAKTKTKKKETKTKLFAAIVMTAGRNTSARSYGDYSAFLSDHKETAISKAMHAKSIWESNGRYGPYIVVVGEVSERVEEAARYTVKAL